MRNASPISVIPQAIVATAPVQRRARARWVDFVDLTKPRMNFLVVVTTAVGYYLAASRSMEWLSFVSTILGTALTAAAASVFNQYAECEYDARMPRTRLRPLPAGRVTPGEALAFGMALGVVGVGWLWWAVNPLTSVLGLLTLLLYVFVYTPLKRTTTLCTVVGAVPGAIPPVMGWTAVHNQLSPEAAALFGILFLWQMPHFLAIAILYRQDYALGGFKMLPVVDESMRFTGRQIVLYSLCLLPMSLMPVGLRMAGAMYLIGAIVLGLVFLGFGISAAASRTRTDARRLFIASILYLPLLLGMMMLDKVQW